MIKQVLVNIVPVSAGQYYRYAPLYLAFMWVLGVQTQVLMAQPIITVYKAYCDNLISSG